MGKSNVGRIPELIPIRYGQMMNSPFAFFICAGLSSERIQACGRPGCCLALTRGAELGSGRNGFAKGTLDERDER